MRFSGSGIGWRRNARRVTSRRLGLSSAEHPLLGAATPLADGERFLLTGRLSATEHRLARRACGVRDGAGAGNRTVGAGFCSGAGGGRDDGVAAGPGGASGAAGRRGGAGAGAGGCAGGGRGRRARAEHLGRLEEAPEGTAWTLHAQGMLSGAEATAALAEEVGLAAWPPVGGTPIALTGLYSTLQAHGYGYGPAFQGLREAWRVGDAVYGRAVLPEALSESAEAYGVHPALLDAALHVLGLVDAGVGRGSDGSLLLPFEWTEVSLLATGARELRVRATVERRGEGEALAHLQLADGSGRAVARVGGLRLREASEAQIREAARSEVQHLYRLDWRAVTLSAAAPEALTLIVVGGDGQLARRLGLDWVESVAALVARLEEGGVLPARVVFDHLAEPASSGGDFLAATHAAAERALSELQFILSDARLTETSVAWLTSGAVATGPEAGAAGLSRAPLWGLVRSARAEHPDRQLQLLDVDAPPAEAALLAQLLSTAAEPELALRHGAVMAPRLARAGSGTSVAADEPRLDPTGTVLITGGLGELGRELARHLVDRHGVRHLVLTSRRGLEAPGAAELVAALQALGAQTVQVVSCDVSDRGSVRSVLSGIPAERRLTGVFHLAGALDDGVVSALTGERLERVLRPKLDGAYHLHELTAEQDLAAFVLFSSAAGLGGAGQANYAAASVFLDALAAERRHRGLAGLSLMWGFWEPRVRE